MNRIEVTNRDALFKRVFQPLSFDRHQSVKIFLGKKSCKYYQRVAFNLS